MYDPVIGRWSVVDPMTEAYSSYSPYAYVGNDPVLFYDPNGMYRVDGKGNITIDAPDEVSNFMGYLRNNSGTSISDMFGHIFNADNGFSWELDPVTVNGGAAFGSGSWIGDAQSQVLNASNIISNFNGQQQSEGSVGQPGALESMLPFWGSGKAAVDYYQNGRWGWGTFHTAMVVSDVFLAKSLATGIGKGAWKFGSHSWSATRKWLGKQGYAEAGQPVHHWAVTQATAKKYGVESLTNQPWNLMTFPNQSLHIRAGHGLNYLGQPGYGALGQLWYGTPTWFKAGMFSGGGRIVD